tara:strand:- start:214 stop:1047 length:834 start_codon:yes stop_codon:yes gene_type:complete
MSLTLSGTNGIVGAGFTFDPSGASVTSGIGTFSKIAVGANNVNPTQALEVKGSSSVAIQVESSAAQYSEVQINNSTRNYTVGVRPDISHGFAIRDASAGANRFIIDTSGNATMTSGNLVIGTAGKGIDFSAQTPTAVSGASNTAEVLDHYEEGTWTPTNVSGQSVDTIANGGAWTISGGAKYTRIGDMVTVYIAHWQIPSTGGNYGFSIGGLPFTNVTGISVGTNTVVSNSTNAEKGLVVAGTNKIYLYAANTITQTTNAGLSTKILYGISATYKVS